MLKRNVRHIALILTMLLLGGIANEAWAYKVTYHILTKPIDNNIYHLAGDFSGKRLEAFRVVDANATGETKIGLPEAFKSPLAKDFTYYHSADIAKSDAAVAMYQYNDKNKSYYYSIKDDVTPINTETYTISSNIDVYVTYEYNAENTIYKLDGSKDYNLSMSGGFLAFNRGRNNRVAVIPEIAKRVSAEALASDDFVKIDVSNIPGTNIKNFWDGNPNPKEEVAGQFHFKFQLVGSDPYNILIRTAYNKNYTYIEKHGSETKLYYKYYKDSYLYWPQDKSGFFLASDDHKQYTKVSTGYESEERDDIPSTPLSGYFKSKGNELVYNSFALLNNDDKDGYVFMITRYVNSSGEISTPGDYKSAKYYFLTHDNDYNNLKSESKTLKEVSTSYSTDQETYLVNNYRFKVKRKCSTAELETDKVLYADVEVSEYFASSSPLEFVPDILKRKYVNFTGAYNNETHTVEFAKFSDVDTNVATVTEDGKRVIWLDYSTNMPFETWTAASSDADSDGAVDYDELKWYNLNVNKSASNSAYWDDTKIKTSTGSSKYARASHFAFIGDPYDLTIVGRKASETDGTPSTLNYMKLDATIENNAAFAASGTTWGIMYDDDKDDYKDCFRLKDNTGEKYLHQNSTENNPLNGTATSSEAVRITATELPTKPYVYYIMRSDKSIAVMSSETHEPSAKLGYNTIPEIIRSPFIYGRTLTFYGGDSGDDGATSAKTNAENQTNAITYAKDTEDDAVQHIVVRYDFPSAGNPYYTYIDGSTSFNVRLNGEYIYYDNGTIKSNASPTNDELGTTAYQWTLGGADPYAMTVKSDGANQYVTANATDKSALGWNTEANATKFIIKRGSEGVYEVMYATGETVDASGTYYNIGRNGTDIKIYQNTTYPHGYDQLSFLLTALDAHNVTYHLIDKQGVDLLQVDSRHSSSETPLFPNDYRSPLVKKYHYYILSNFDKTNGSDGVEGTAADIYTLKASQTELSKVGSETHIYVTYDTSDAYDLQNKKTMYLLKYDMGDQFRQENGSDALLADPAIFEGTEAAKKARYQAVYPYCNGDCNFFVYGQEQYDIQQQSAASTRTRWAWFLESANNDPYHVKICSRQIETYNGDENRAYFHTYAETFGGTKHVITGLSWPGISGVQGTEYMVLGTTGQFRLLTTNAIAVDLNDDGDTADEGETNVRHTVNSFEQYWKTWDTVRKKVLGDGSATARQSDPNTVPATPATTVATNAGKDNRTYLEDMMSWHSYEQWAYAKRWNGYNISGATSKGWEEIEHWFQTVGMGEGYFDLVPITIDPALILLDQHGWEIMRKPLPTGPDDSDKDIKYDAIRPYDSPMVKEYHFWTKASKRSGFHQYYSLGQQVKVDGVAYVSSSLTDLPPFDATDVHDKKGNLLDQYVTYVVKDEYVQGLGEPFLIRQGSHFAYNNSDAAAIGTAVVPATGGMSQYIIDNISDLTAEGSKKNELWYLKPNADIDIEMGYQDATKFPGGYAHGWTNDYTVTDFSATGFDPYNIQISSVSNTEKYFVTNATTAKIDEGATTGDGTGNALGAQVALHPTLKGGMDNRTLQMTNATFMAVQDAAGNMQLMPRFDQDKRMKDFTTLTTASDNGTYTKLYRPQVYTYQIIDNDGNESLRYQGGGDLVPQTPAHFKSPLAKDFKYYTGSMMYTTDASNETAWTAATEAYKKTATSDDDMKDQVGELTTSGTYYFKIEYFKRVSVTIAKGEDDAVYTTTESIESAWNSAGETYKKTASSEADLTTQAKALTSTGDFFFKIVYYKVVKFNGTTNSTTDGIYKDVKDKVDISNREITGSLRGATLTDNTVYVRYSYDEEADELAILKGKWLTMQLNNYNMYYDTGADGYGIYDDTSSSKPANIDANARKWQWKFLESPFSEPDPYAVPLYNRSKTDGMAIDAMGAILSHTSGNYVLIKARQGNMTYQFLKSNDDTSKANTWGDESNFKSTYCSFDETKSQLKLLNEVTRTFNYRIYTNDNVFAVSADQDNIIEDNTPTLPESIRSPLLNADQFLYYGAEGDMGNSAKELKYLYGLYDDIVYVRYTAYDLKKTEYKVPNVRNATSEDPVAKGEGSNDASLDINRELIYNIIWYDDNMMQSANNSDISGLANQDLQGGDAYVWQFEGNDPYAIKIKHKKSGKYAVGSSTLETVAANASPSKTFMLLPTGDEWEYGVLQVTGATGDDAGKKLTGVGNALTADASTSPTKFIIFGLSTHKVIYHLVIANIDNTVNIPYRATKGGDETTTPISGSSCRDLTTGSGATYQLGSTINGVNYCVDEGHITLGDPLKVPDELKRPNCKYFYYVEGIYDDAECNTPNTSLNALYKGLQITEMGTEPQLLGKTVRINVEYQFDDGLPTNNGSHFVTNSNGTEWYTFETSDATPYLAHYTYKDAKLTGVAGRVGHYTNDFLWSPVGDPYGFKMYNRYVYKNGGHTEYVMTTTDTPEDNADLIIMTDDSPNKPVYELLPGNSDGYFKVQALTVPGTGTPYYIDNSTGTMKLKTSTKTEWHFGLSDALLEPYYLGAGNVGGLTTTVKAGTGKEKSGKKLYEEAANLMEKQAVVFNPDNIVDFTPGYYRVFNEPNSLGITVPRYLSGYTHKTELTQAIPMHFYEREGMTTTFDVLGSGFTSTAATRGQIPIVAPEYDPASIFYITGSGPYTMQTQGLYVDGAVMAESAGSNSNFHVTDIGGAVVVLHDGNATIANRYYLNYDQSSNIYDVKYTNNIGIADATKWCMEPANKKGLRIETHSGGEEAVLTDLWYYSSYCVPFDLLIQNKNENDGDGVGIHSSNAYTCVAAKSPWNETMLHPKSIGKYNAAPYADNDYFVPAGTPVLFSTKRATQYIKATIPTTTPSTPITTIFSAKYLEQLLPGYDDNKRVYVFGPKMEGTITLNNDGTISATLPSLGNTNVGFHINANPNKEAGLTKASWSRNNYYVLHNKIYYKSDTNGASAPQHYVQFVPVIFDDEEPGEEELQPDGSVQVVGDGCIYDLMGRKVATREQVEDGTWRERLAPGIYILNGKKFKK